jgi:hypothetical protein
MLYQQTNSNYVLRMSLTYRNNTQTYSWPNYISMEHISPFHHRNMLSYTIFSGSVQGQGTALHPLLFQKGNKKSRMLRMHLKTKFKSNFLYWFVTSAFFSNFTFSIYLMHKKPIETFFLIKLS